MLDLSNLIYRQRLIKLNLPTLQYRRLREDMTEMCKVVTKKCNGKILNLFIKHGNIARGHQYRIEKYRARRNLRQYNFAHRVVNDWNSL